MVGQHRLHEDGRLFGSAAQDASGKRDVRSVELVMKKKQESLLVALRGRDHTVNSRPFYSTPGLGSLAGFLSGF